MSSPSLVVTAKTAPDKNCPEYGAVYDAGQDKTIRRLLIRQKNMGSIPIGGRRSGSSLHICNRPYRMAILTSSPTDPALSLVRMLYLWLSTVLGLI